MKMCQIQLEKSEVQEVIDELTTYYQIHKAIIITLTLALLLTTFAYCYTSVKSVEQNVKSQECLFYLQNDNQAYQNNCL